MPAVMEIYIYLIVMYTHMVIYLFIAVSTSVSRTDIATAEYLRNYQSLAAVEPGNFFLILHHLHVKYKVAYPYIYVLHR